jgi:hypothetical protein
MGLICKPAIDGNLTERQFRRENESLSSFDSSACNVTVRRIAETDAKYSAKMKRAQLYEFCQLFRSKRDVKVRLNMHFKHPRLPRRETTANNLLGLSTYDGTEFCGARRQA